MTPPSRLSFFLHIFSLCFLTCTTNTLDAKEIVLKLAGKNLFGTLEEVDNKENLIIIHPGSGPSDRNSNQAGLQNNCLKMVAEGLKEKNIASLRIDKRGVGKSILAYDKNNYTLQLLAKDLAAWGKHAKTLGYKKVYLLGHSEGALISILAMNEFAADGLISIAGTGRPFETILREQLKKNLKPDTFQAADTILQSLEQKEIVKNVPKDLLSLFHPLTQPYLISSIGIDPAEALKKLDCPILIIQGTTDIQVTEVDSTRLNKAKPNSKLVVIKGMNHVLKTAPLQRDANLLTYNLPKLPLHPKLTPAITIFILNE